MSKRMKTIEQLKAEIATLQRNYEEQKKAEAASIGKYIQDTFGVDTLATFRGAYEVKRIGGEA